MTQPPDPAAPRAHPVPLPVPSSDASQQLTPSHGGNMPAAPAPASTGRRVGRKRSAWAVWWLSGITSGIYYLIWYYQINAELRAFAPEAVQVSPGKATVAQLLPIFQWVSLANTSARLNDAHRAVGSPVRVSGGMAILGTFWFNSQTRYLQRRINALWDAQDTLSAHSHRQSF